MPLDPLIAAALRGIAASLADHPEHVEAAARYLSDRALEQYGPQQLPFDPSYDAPISYEPIPFPQPPRQEYAETRRPICVKCRAIAHPDYQFCPHCGGQEFLNP